MNIVPRLRVTAVMGSRIVSLPDYAFTNQDIADLEALSLRHPSHPICVKEADGRVHIVPLSSLLIDVQGIRTLNFSAVK